MASGNAAQMATHPDHHRLLKGWRDTQNWSHSVFFGTEFVDDEWGLMVFLQSFELRVGPCSHMMNLSILIGQNTI
jgi:hypothetical protein